MTRWILTLVGLYATTGNTAMLNFDADALGAQPSGWTVGVTGNGKPKWTVEDDAGTKVLKQSGSGTFPWAVRTDTSVGNGTVEVQFKPVSGKEDAAGGVVWRWKDGDNYYVARANALENNVSLYYTVDGRRNTIKYVDAPVQLGRWHSLKVDFNGDHLTVALDGKTYIQTTDGHIKGVGAVGVWTKADSVTEFRDFRYEAR